MVLLFHQARERRTGSKGHSLPAREQLKASVLIPPCRPLVAVAAGVGASGRKLPGRCCERYRTGRNPTGRTQVFGRRRFLDRTGLDTSPACFWFFISCARCKAFWIDEFRGPASVTRFVEEAFLRGMEGRCISPYTVLWFWSCGYCISIVGPRLRCRCRGAASHGP